MAKLTQFYVYVYRDPRPGENKVPIYVGKGKGKRMNSQRRSGLFREVLAKLRKSGLKPIVKKVRCFDKEADALLHEIKLIAKYGRRDLGTGPLYNRTIGGDGMVGYIRLAELRALDGKNGKQRWKDKAYRRKIRAAIKRRFADKEWIESFRKAVRKRSRNLEYRAKLAAARQRLLSNPRLRKKLIEKLRDFNRRAFTKPSVRRKRLEQNRRTAKNPRWLKKMQATWKRVKQDPVYIKNHAAAMKRRNETNLR